MSKHFPRALGLACALVALLPRVATAEQIRPDHVIAGGKGQRALVVRVEGDAIHARACAKPEGCDPKEGGSTLRLPESAKSSTASVDRIQLTESRAIAAVRLRPDGEREFLVLLAASPTGTAEAPKLVFSGWIGRQDRTGRSTELGIGSTGAQLKPGAPTLSLTERATLCGREVVTNVRRLDPATLELTWTGGPDPLGGTRATARSAKAAAVPARESFRILGPRSASSGKPAALLDGDPATAWFEEEPGVGTHAFVTLRAPTDVPLVGVDLSIGPAPTELTAPRTPKTIAIVTDVATYTVELPASSAGTTLHVPFEGAIRTSCVGLVLDQANPAPARTAQSKGPAPKPNEAQVYVSELSARTELDGKPLIELARALGKDGAGSRPITSLLAASGDRGVTAAIAAYPELDGPGRDLARRVIDPAPCEQKLALYIPLLLDEDPDDVDRARDRVRRCGKVSLEPLLAAMRAARGEARATYAEEAALVLPTGAVPVLVELLGASIEDGAERKILRRALAKAALRGTGPRAFDAALRAPSFAAMPLEARIDVLRALGESAGKVDSGGAAFAATAKDATTFRDRFLLIGPAAELARAGDPGAVTWLDQALGDDADGRIRVRAAERAHGVPKVQASLFARLDDAEPRAREAALKTLAQEGPLLASQTERVILRLEKDPWTFVRRAAALAVASAPKGALVDERIGAAVDFEPSPAVRAEMVRALGVRGAIAQREVVLARAVDAGEALDVRLRAVEALGVMCDSESVTELTTIAIRGRAPLFETDRKLAAAALLALGRIAPPDLAVRIAPLVDPRVPSDVREAAKAAKSKKGCPR